MGDLTTIGFKPGSSPLHRLDPRTKQLLMIGLSAASLQGNIVFLVFTSAVMLFLIHAANLPIGRLLHEIRYFLFFLLFVFFARTVTVTNQWFPLAFTEELIGEAIIVCWRLFLVVVMGLLMMHTTRISHMRAALIWLLRPVPWINENKAATMVGLVVRFLPLILFQASEIGDAMRARGIEKRKNPLHRLVKYTIPLLRRVFLRADELAETMQARCYNENRRVPQLTFAKRDLIAAGAGFMMCLTVFIP